MFCHAAGRREALCLACENAENNGISKTTERMDRRMSREEVFERLNEVFRDVFDDEEITVTDATTADDIEEWDSLEHINLLAAVEQEFGMKFNMGQVVSMKNVGEMADIIISQVG